MALVGCAAVSLVAAVGIVLTPVERELPNFPDASLTLPADAVVRADELVSLPGQRIVDLDAEAPAALAGYWYALGTDDDDGWQIDFGDAGDAGSVAVERAAIGAFEEDRSIERSETLALAGVGEPPPLPIDGTLAERSAALAAMAEVSGSADGVLASVPANRTGEVLDLALSVGLEPRVVPNDLGRDLVLDRVEDLVTVASWDFGCLDRVPLVGGRGCDGPTSKLAFVDESTPFGPITDWRVATTGPLDRSEPHWIAAADGGVGWTNGEAQQYRDTSVDDDGEGWILTASPHPEARIDRAPFDSGMIISEATFGWGLIEVDVVVPTGAGLWPAIWLLDAEACEGPGECAGYATTDYHEIDLLETSGGTEVSTSVHWFDERIRTLSTTDFRRSIVDGSVHTIGLDRRPGLLIWTLDGVEIDRVTGPATSTMGPHRAAPMRLIVNLAVGGSFAGDRLLGPGSQWWGSSIVPDSYPDLDWDTASLHVLEARFTSLDDAVLVDPR